MLFLWFDFLSSFLSSLHNCIMQTSISIISTLIPVVPLTHTYQMQNQETTTWMYAAYGYKCSACAGNETDNWKGLLFLCHHCCYLYRKLTNIFSLLLAAVSKAWSNSPDCWGCLHEVWARDLQLWETEREGTRRRQMCALTQKLFHRTTVNTNQFTPEGCFPFLPV